MSEEDSGGEAKPLDLLNQLEHILESDPLINEVGFIHPSQFVELYEEATSQPRDGIGKSEMSKDGYSGKVFWSRDHKLGISTQVLLPLYRAAKRAFMSSLEAYKMSTDSSVKKDDFRDENVSVEILESEVMKHSRPLLLLSCDFGTAWNSRKLILSNKQHLMSFMDELRLSALVLSYAPKSERAWSHRRWVIKMIAGKCSNLEEIVEKESELVKQIAEKSKMNYRAWSHRCWFVSYMSREQVLHELNKSRGWDGLHVADNSCFHYRTRLLLKMLEEESRHRRDLNACAGYSAELRQSWKDELDWDEILIKRYVGRESLWLHRRFLSLCWIKHFVTNICHVAGNSDHKTTVSHDIDIFLDNEQISGSLGTEVQEKLPLQEAKALLNKVCPAKSFLWNSLSG